MKTTASFKAGEIICSAPADYAIENDVLILSNDCCVKHGAQFNATVISRFIIATQHLCRGEEVVVNLNTLVYDAGKDGDLHVPGFKNLSDAEKQHLYIYADESVRQHAITDGFIPHSCESGIAVVRTPKSSLVAVSRGSHAGQSVVFTATGVLLPFPVRSTIELPGEQHLRLTGGSEFIRHACEPNLRLEVDGDVIRGIALRPIEEGERLTFNYLYTEWDIAQPFRCGCNTYSCYGFIRGFQYLDAEQQMHMLPNASAAIQERYNAPPTTLSVQTMLQDIVDVTVSSAGRVFARRHVPSGTVLLEVKNFRKGSRVAFLDGLRVPHSCDANTILLEGRLVASRSLVAGDPLTVNLSLLFYELPLPFECSCGSINCSRIVRGFSGLSDNEKNRLMPFTKRSVLLDAFSCGFQVQSSNSLVKIERNPLIGETTYAADFIPKGTHIYHVKGFLLSFPTAHTLFLGDGRHLLCADGAQCMAHGCEPNTRLSVSPSGGSADWVAIRDIYPGELLCYNYLTSEWDMVAPFHCVCGSASCHGVIRGFRYLDEHNQLRLWSQITTGVRSCFVQQQHRSVLQTLDSSLVYVHGTSGEICLARDMASGAELFHATTFYTTREEVVLDDVRIKHSCNPTAVLLEGHVVLCRGSLRGDAVTLNINHLTYNTEPFACSCGASNCVSEVRGFSGLTDDQKNTVMLYVDPQARVMATNDGYRIRSSCPLVEVKPNGNMGQATFAKCDIQSGTRFFDVSGLVIPFATMYTILLSEGRHLLFADGAQCLAHSCAPNVRIITDSTGNRLECFALRDIKEGEVISFNYLTTEWDMQSPFVCLCGAPTCYRDIRGFKHLEDNERQSLWSMATPAIKSLAADAKGTDAWAQIASTHLFVSETGLVHVTTDTMEGITLFHVSSVEIANQCLYVDGLRLRHHCSPSVALIDHKIVPIRALYAGDELTIDLNCLSYSLPEEFLCSCGKANRAHVVGGFKLLEESEKMVRMAVTDPSVRAAAFRDGYSANCSSSVIQIRRGESGVEVFASIDISAGVRFINAEGFSLSFPTTGTVQLGEGKHILLSNEVQFLSHSCCPNVRICVDAVNSKVDCEALRDIRRGELLTFNYNTTEWELHAPFQCHCQSSNCVQNIFGFKFLTSEQRLALCGQVTPAIRRMAATEAVVRLFSPVEFNEKGKLQVTSIVRRGMVLLECSGMDIQPTQISLGRDSYMIQHMEDANTVFVEGRFIAMRTIEAAEILTVDMNLFVYDVKSLFPLAVTDECQGFSYLEEMKKQRKLYLCEPPVRSQAMRDGWIVKSTSSRVEIRQNGLMGQTAYVSTDITDGEVLFRVTGLVVPFPTMYTICVGEDRHLLFGDAAECIAHHCDPNLQVVVYEEEGALEFVTLRSIAAGEMVTFNYCTTEWVMNSPFVCLCGSPHCGGTIRGFSHLNEANRQRLWSITSPVVKRYASKENWTLVKN